ncbi:hybrid sensor histidine kinase/response regulator [Telluria sp. B2]
MAMLAHELRNPLAAISSALQLWGMIGNDAARQQELLALSRRQVGNLTRLVDDLLEMARIDRGAVELHQTPLDLRDVLDSALLATRAQFERRELVLLTRIAPAAYRMVGDATRLEQVLVNLLANAAKYSDSGGSVEVSLERTAAADGDLARLAVRDSGRGIPADRLGAIFDIFVQVDTGIDRTRGGLGIGLSLVRALVGLHGGRVWAESEGMGRGSRFVVELPLREAASSECEADEAAPAPRAVLPQRILVVEDNADARMALHGILAAWGCSVSTAASGDEGLAQILAQRPDVAVVDIGLPGLDGFELARRVRMVLGEASPRLVALTGYSSAAVRSAALEAGFDVHIVKPCSPATLAEALAG